MFDDDMLGIINKLLYSRRGNLGFPLYYYSLPSRLKMLIDRQLPMLLPFMDRNAPSGGHEYRYDMSGERYVLISTCGFYTQQREL